VTQTTQLVTGAMSVDDLFLTIGQYFMIHSPSVRDNTTCRHVISQLYSILRANFAINIIANWDQTRALSRSRRAAPPPPPPPLFGPGAARRGTCQRWYYTTRQKLLKIQTCIKLCAAIRLVTIRSQFYLLVTSALRRRHFAGGGAPTDFDRRRRRSAALQANVC